jgi:lipopolysaccharide export system permease protein
MPRLISSYIFKEMVVPFIISICVLTAMSLLSKSAKLIEMIVNYGVDYLLLLMFIVSVLPSFLIYIIPMSFLVAVLFTFNRLSSESELTAMKASGLSLYRLFRPVITLAILAYILSLLVTLYLFPLGNNMLRKTLYNIARTKAVVGIQEKTFNTSFDGLTMYVDNVDERGGRIENIFISDTREEGEPTMIFAKNGIFLTEAEDMAVTLRLFDGTIHISEELSESYRLISFNTYDFNFPTQEGGVVDSTASKTNRELYLNELVSRIRATGARGENQAPFIIDLHKRFALPASVFVFALIGVPLAIQKVRTARFTSFSMALGVVLTYYLLSTVMESLGEGANINPILAVWGSDIIMGIAGCYIFFMTSRDSSIIPFQWSARLQKLLRKRS